MADGEYYSMRKDIELIFGVENVTRWADPENSADTALIEDRIDWANQQAEYYVNGRLKNGRYAIPFTKPCVQIVVLISASFAGAFLYDTRRVVDTQGDEIAAQRRNAEMWINQILNGQLRLVDACGDELSSKKNYPIASKDFESSIT